MSTWPRSFSLYEINTWVWLAELGKKSGHPVDLHSVPPEAWDEVAAFGFDAVWLMGVWERSPSGIAIANRNEGLLTDFRRALPDFRTEDNVGSPYCVRRYSADPHLGGPEGLARARRELATRGMRLILDFVPNHVAPDHPWVGTQPGYFIHGTAEEAEQAPASYIRTADGVYACGRDPYFPAWPDVLQLNAFDEGLRTAARETLLDLATQCDGVRCDMAMLLLNTIFERTWGARAGRRPASEYWVDLIRAVKHVRGDFLFVAEAYWDLEWELQQQGFDFCYDKRLYDRLEHDNARSVRLHLGGDPGYQHRLVRFVENHDEPRAAAAFPSAKARAAAVASSTLPGVRLFHEGQFEGRRVRLPVFLGRRPDEPVDEGLRAFYATLLAAIATPVCRNGHWRLCECAGWPDNASFENLVSWDWEGGEERVLVVVNLSGASAQARVKVNWDATGRMWSLVDRVSGVAYERSGDDLSALFVDLAPWSFHVFECRGRRTS